MNYKIKKKNSPKNDIVQKKKEKPKKRRWLLHTSSNFLKRYKIGLNDYYQGVIDDHLVESLISTDLAGTSLSLCLFMTSGTLTLKYNLQTLSQASQSTILKPDKKKNWKSFSVVEAHGKSLEHSKSFSFYKNPVNFSQTTKGIYYGIVPSYSMSCNLIIGYNMKLWRRSYFSLEFSKATFVKFFI